MSICDRIPALSTPLPAAVRLGENRNLSRPINILLVNFPGIPSSPNNFIGKDLGLGQLAALAQKQGAVLVRDYNTPDLLARFSPPGTQEKFIKVFNKLKPFFTPRKVNGFLDEAVNILQGLILKSQKAQILNILKSADEDLNRHFVKACNEIAAELSGVIKSRDIAVVGFKLWMGEGTLGTILIAEKLRERFPDLKIVAGGPQASIFTEYLFRNDLWLPELGINNPNLVKIFDVIAIGEAVLSWPLILDWVKGEIKQDEIPGIIYYDEAARQIRSTPRQFVKAGSIPSPDFSETVYPMPENSYFRIIPVMSSKGCAHQCDFCIHPWIHGTQKEIRDPDQVAEEIIFLLDAFNSKAVEFVDSNPDPASVIKLLQKIKERSRRINFTMFAGIGSFIGKPDLLRELAGGGAFSLFYGLEDFSQISRFHKFGKGADLKTISEVIARTVAAGIIPAGSLIYPNEKSDAGSEKINLAALANLLLYSVLVQPLIVMPHTPVFADLKGSEIYLEGSEAAYAKAGLEFSLKYLFPADFSKTLPVSYGGLKWAEILKKTAGFKLKARGLGIPCLPSDVMFLAKYFYPDFDFKADQSSFAGQRKKLAAFENFLVRLFFARDTAGINNLIKVVNQNIGKEF